MRDVARRRLTCVLSLFVLGPILLAGCGSGYKTTPDGRIISLGEWRDLKKGESRLTFAGEQKPEIKFARRRLIDNRVTQEHIKLVPEVWYRSFIYLTYLPYGVYYTNETTRRLHDRKDFLKRTKGYFAGRTMSECRARQNSAGRYLFVSADFGSGATCVYARQGLETHAFTKQKTEANYEAILTFLHCSSKPEQEILALFDSIKVQGSKSFSGSSSVGGGG